MKRVVPLLPLLILCACAGPKQLNISNRELNDKMPGPSVEGLKAGQEADAKNALARSDFKHAGEAYRMLLDRDASNKDYLLGYAEAARRGGHYDSAEVSYNQLLKLDPENVDAKEGKGLTQLGEEKFGDAGRTLSEVMKTDPKRWRTLNAMGLLFVRRNLPDSALAYFAEALRQSPNNVSVLNNVGLTQATQHDYPAAQEALKKASDLAPPASVTKQQVDLNLAMVYGVSGDLTTAERIAGQYLKGATLHNNLGMYAALAQNEPMAKDYFNMALTESPKYYDTAWKNLRSIQGGESAKGAIAVAPSEKRVKIQ